MLDQHDLNQLVDPVLGGSYNKDQLENVVKTATLCTQQIPVQRPRMHEVCPLNIYINSSVGSPSIRGSQAQHEICPSSSNILDIVIAFILIWAS